MLLQQSIGTHVHNLYTHVTPFSQCIDPCNVFRSVWSMFSYNTFDCVDESRMLAMFNDLVKIVSIICRLLDTGICKSLSVFYIFKIISRSSFCTACLP